MSVLRRTFATRSSACVGPVDQHFASYRPIPLPALRVARTLGEAGMKSIDRAGAPMQVKDVHVEIDGATKRAVIHGKPRMSPACPQAVYILQAVGLCMQMRSAHGRAELPGELNLPQPDTS